jgi:hypothetical protein
MWTTQEKTLLQEDLRIYACIETEGPDDGTIAPKHVVQKYWNVIFVYFKSVAFWRMKLKYLNLYVTIIIKTFSNFIFLKGQLYQDFS